MGAEHADRLPGLHEQGLVRFEPSERREDAVEGVPRARRASGAAVHDEIVGPLRDVGIEVVLEHPERRLLGPPEAVERRAAGGAHHARGDGHTVDSPPSPRRSRNACTAAFHAGPASRGAA